MNPEVKNKQFLKFSAYGFLKNLRFFDAFFILFLIDKGLTYTEIGILYATRELFINVFEIPSGIIADTYGRISTLAGSLLSYILSFILFYYSNQFSLFLLAFILFGIGEAFRSGTHKGIIIDYLKINNWDSLKIEYYGHTRSWSQIGSALSALIAGFIVFLGGNYESIFLYSIIPYILNLALVLSYPKEINHPLKTVSSGKSVSLMATVKPFLKIIRKPKVLSIINTSAVHSAFLKVIKDYIQPLILNVAILLPFMLNTDVDKKNGLIIGITYFVIYLLTSKASKLSSSVAAKNKSNIAHITLVSGFLLGIATGLFYYYDLWILSLIAFIAIYIVENIRKPFLTGFVADNVPSEILTTVISAQSLLKTTVTIVMSFLFGMVADIYGIGISLFTVSGLLFLLTMIFKIFEKIINDHTNNNRSLG